MRTLLAAVTAIAMALAGCAQDEATQGRTPMRFSEATQECVDADGDGYGDRCAAGIDCDDDDANVTDECVRAEVGSASPSAGSAKSVTAASAHLCNVGDERVCGAIVESLYIHGVQACTKSGWSQCQETF